MAETAPPHTPIVPTCRVDLWLWRARFTKTRGLATRLIETGAVRLTHRGVQTRIDKPGRLVRPGDALVFVIDQRLFAIRVEALGKRRGPPTEARTLYSDLNESPEPALK